MKALTRRRVLGGMGAGALLTPFVPTFTARGQNGELPKRIIFFYSSNGTIRESWLPEARGGQLTLSPILAPLETHRERLLVVDGLDYKVCLEKGDKFGHYGGMNTALTGAPALVVDPNDPEGASMPPSASIDQLIGAHIGDGLKRRSMELGIQVNAYNPTVGCTAYAGPNQPIYPQNDPRLVFQQLFDGFTDPDAEVDETQQRRRARRGSVIDYVHEDLRQMQANLPAWERQKVEAHLDALRQLEQSLTTGAGAAATAACAVPPNPTAEPWDPAAIPALGRLQMDLLVMALACDLTRVGTIQFGRAGAQHRFTWLGPEFNADPDNGPNDSTSGLHGLAHNEANPDSRAKLVTCHNWYAGELAYLLDKLASVPEGDGSMLDQTLVVWFNEMATGGSHSLVKTPWVLAGNVGGFFRTGRLVQTPDGTPHNQLLMSICQAMGLDPSFVGDPDLGADALSGLT